MRIITDVGLMIEGHDIPRASALAQARAHLIKVGYSAFAVDEMTADRPALVAHAWWGGDDVGFVQAHHDQAVPVTVVNVQVAEDRP